MQTYIKLQREGSRRTPFVHYAQVIEYIGETLLEAVPSVPVSHDMSCDLTLFNGRYRTSWDLMELDDLQGDADAFASLYLANNIARKASAHYGLEACPEERLKTTLEGFLEREMINKRINQDSTWGYDRVTGEHHSDVLGDQLLLRARDIIYDIVGEQPDFDRIVAGCQFGNGASATLPRREAQSPIKWMKGRSVTRRLRKFASNLVSSSAVWSTLTNSDPVSYVDSHGRYQLPHDHFTEVAGAILDVVPKTISEDRIILKEPEMNGFVQKGIGRELRRLLRKPISGTDGINLNNSGNVNQVLAREGSIHGHLATVDGKRASDSLTLALYEFLFPPKWYELFVCARSPYVLIPDTLTGERSQLVKLDMMSGMGNGFTFEAESIIFYAIGLACAERSKLPFASEFVSIHGDDLIVPSDVFTDVAAAYKAAGVEINVEKSFFKCAFRESCGGHFLNGQSVKPFYVKNQNGKSRGDWFWLYNSLLLWLNERSDSYRTSNVGSKLITLLMYLGTYAASGKPLDWRVPVDYSRRAGLFSGRPPLKGRSSWKTRCVTVVSTKEKTSEDGAYLEWLSQDKGICVYDIIMGRKPSSDSLYETVTDTLEADRFRRLTVWNDFPDCGLSTPLWYFSQLRRN